jgi:acyl-CoA thioester hydrolase
MTSSMERDEVLVETHRGTVYPWQCDHMGHMNVMWYVGKFDEATWNLFALMGITAAFLRERGRGMAAVQQNITYRRELYAGETIVVRSAFLEVRQKVARFVHEMYNAESGVLAAVCHLTGVHIDSSTRKSCAFPEDILQRGQGLVRAYTPAS